MFYCLLRFGERTLENRPSLALHVRIATTERGQAHHTQKSVIVGRFRLQTILGDNNEPVGNKVVFLGQPEPRLVLLSKRTVWLMSPQYPTLADWTSRICLNPSSSAPASSRLKSRSKKSSVSAAFSSPRSFGPWILHSAKERRTNSKSSRPFSISSSDVAAL